MNKGTAAKIEEHLSRCFGEEPQRKTTVGSEPAYGMLIYAPDTKYDFWKICTVGASDYKMPKREGVRYGETASLRNEYMMFVPAGIDFSPNKNSWRWYAETLWRAASFAQQNKTGVVVTDILDFKDRTQTMSAATLLFPEVIEDTDILQLKLGLGKVVTFLQVMPITAGEADLGDALYERFYPHQGDRPSFYLARRGA